MRHKRTFFITFTLLSIVILSKLLLTIVTKNEGLKIVPGKIIVDSSYATENPTVLNYFLKIYNQKQLLFEEFSNITDSYSDFKTILSSAEIKMPVTRNMVFQGIATVDDDYILLTAYNDTKRGTSRLYVLNSVGRIINIVDLGNTSHVGAIAYDSKNGLIWIPGEKGTLEAYILSDILEETRVEHKYVFKGLSDDFKDYRSNNRTIDYLTVDGDFIYIGNFSLKKPNLLKKYEICFKDSKIELVFKNKYLLPVKTQSVVFYENELGKFMLTSNSYGRKNPSQLSIFSLNDGDYDFTKKEKKTFKLPPLIEQVSVKDDELYVIFESGAEKFSDCKERVHLICKLDMKKIVN